MIPDALKNSLEEKVATVDHPREMVVDVMFAIQEHYGYLTDEGVEETARLVGMSPLEVEQLATFYTFIYREAVGKYVIHVCDSVVCWMNGFESIKAYLSEKLGIQDGETTSDGLFTLLPVCCVGYCDRSPAILINKKVYGNLTTEKIDEIIEKLKAEALQNAEVGMRDAE
jgi:NADH-quinone oxidoreductase subunit E